MKKFIRNHWFKAIVIIILLSTTIVYYQNQQAQIQLTREKQQNDYVIQVEKLRTEKLLNGLKQERLEQEIIDKEYKEKKRKLDLSDCLQEAEKDYWEYMKFNGTYIDDEGIQWANNSIWDRAKKIRESKEDKCFKQYGTFE